MVVTVVSVGSIAPEIVTFVGVLLMPPLLLSPPQPASTTSSVVSVAWRKGWNERGGLFMWSVLRLSRRWRTPNRRGRGALQRAHGLRSISKCLGRRFRLRACDITVGARSGGSGQIRANSSGFPESIQQNHAVARNTGCVGSALVTH